MSDGDSTRPSRNGSPDNALEPSSPSKAQEPIIVSSSAENGLPTFRSSHVPAPSSTTLESPQASRLHANGDTADQNGHHQSLQVPVSDPKEPLENFGWDDLEERFCKKMEECEKAEKELEGEFNEWLQVCQGPYRNGVEPTDYVKVFKAWSSVTSVHEPERAHKRYCGLLSLSGIDTAKQKVLLG